jgi:hypothetical protein
MIIPTVGRVLHYYPAPNEFSTDEFDPPHAAIIVRVWSNTKVNLVCFDHNGSAYARQNVFLAQNGDPVSADHAHAVWPMSLIAQVNMAPISFTPISTVGLWPEPQEGVTTIVIPPHPDLQPGTPNAPSEQAIAQSLEGMVGPVGETAAEAEGPIKVHSDGTVSVDLTDEHHSAQITQDNSDVHQP